MLPGARLLCLNSPLNPTGTAFDADALRGDLRAGACEENAGRERRGERPLYVMYDQVYWMLCFGGHHARDAAGAACRRWRATPIFVDGISKAFAGDRRARGLGRRARPT